MTVAIKRVYETAARADGARVLVDRLWPRGLTKTKAAVDEWLRDLAPSDELRRWYHAQPDQGPDDPGTRDPGPTVKGQNVPWQSFRKKYLKELSQPEAQDALRQLYQLAHKRKRLTLLFASKNETHNNAAVLKELLDGMRKPPTGTGPGAIQVMRKRDAAVRRR